MKLKNDKIGTNKGNILQSEMIKLLNYLKEKDVTPTCTRNNKMEMFQDAIMNAHQMSTKLGESHLTEIKPKAFLI